MRDDDTYTALVSRYILSNVFLPQCPAGGKGDTVAGSTNSDNAGLIRSDLMNAVSALTSPVWSTALSRERMRNLQVSYVGTLDIFSLHGGSRAVVRIKKCD